MKRGTPERHRKSIPFLGGGFCCFIFCEPFQKASCLSLLTTTQRPFLKTPSLDFEMAAKRSKQLAKLQYNTDDPTKIFELIKPIGKGAFGFVYLAKKKKDDSLYAIKTCTLDDEEGFEDIRREISIISQCDNPHIVKFYDSYVKGDALWIVMEFCGGGSLADVVQTLNAPLEEDHIAYTIRHVLLGLEYLHQGHRLHRDIKGGNILLTDSGKVKLADFGVSAQLAGNLAKRNTFVGTPHWMAPEVIKEDKYDGKADIWSIGITTLELAEVVPPYANQHPVRVLFLIPRNDPPKLKGSKWSDTFRDFLSHCLQTDAEERWSPSKLLAHPFLTPRWKESPLISYIQKYKEMKKHQPSDLEKDEIKRFQEMEKNESSSDDEDFSSDSEEFSDFSPMSSMVIVPQEGKKAVDVILEKSNKLGNSVKKREKSVIKKKIDQKNDQGEKEVLSRELMNIYRKDCMMGVPFLSLGTAIVPEALLSNDISYDRHKLISNLVPDAKTPSIPPSSLTPPMENLLRSHQHLKNNPEELKDYEKQQYVVNDLASTLRTIFQI